MEIEEIVGLKPGGIYVVQAKHPFRTREDFETVKQMFKAAGEELGFRFLLLDSDFQFVKLREIDADVRALVAGVTT